MSVSLVFCCFFLSCNRKTIELPAHFFSLPEEEEGESSTTQLASEEEKEEGFMCLEEGTECWQFSECKTFCEDLFFKKEQRKECYNWPISLLEDFQNLQNIMKEESFSDIEAPVFKCFLKLTEDRKTILFKDFDKEDAKEFLEEVANNPELAFALAGEDKGDFSILRILFKKIKNRIPSAMSEELSKGKNFLILLDEDDNRSAWVWFNDYIIDYCRGDSSCKEPLDYYCEILEDVRHKTLTEFFENSHFKRKYKNDIESKSCGQTKCEYASVSDFKEMCDSI